MALFLATAFTVAAMMPSDEVCCDELKPLEVQKHKVSGPAAVVIENPAIWRLEITVINNLEPVVVDNEIEQEPENELVFYATRGEGEPCCESRQSIGQSTITGVFVKDTLPGEFELVEFVPSRGVASIESDEQGATLLTWNVGNLEPKAKATLELSLRTTNGGFSKPGNYLINSGATASGFLYSTQEILTDGPTRSIFVSVTDGDPNELPIADAGINQMAFEDNPVYLDGSGSYDPDGSVVKYEWFMGEERIGNSKTFMTYLPVGVHTVMLRVEDNRRSTDTEEVTVTIYKEGAKVPGGVMIGIVRDATTYRGFDPYIVVSNENYAISTWTDMGGNYRIIGIPEGHYEVSCQSEGYRDHYGIVDIPENGEVQYDIDMFRA
jgi:hypothetical protein